MKMARTLMIAAIGVLILTPAIMADVRIGAELRITPTPRSDLEVYVWPDRGMDATYHPGERIRINVEVTRDAFLILYNIDTRGRLNILFPSSPWEDNFVQAGDVITFPRRWDDFDWTVEGPSGVEYVQAIASEIPISLPEWPVYRTRVKMPSHISPHPDLRDFYSGSDRYAYIDVVNRDICGRYYDWAATDVATFYVSPRPVYHRIGSWDPWPNVFYGAIYIGWPVGARIYVDNIYIGIAPCYVPRHYTGRRVITCYDGPRLIRRHEVNCFSKRDYYAHRKPHGIRDVVYKKGRYDANDHFRYEKSNGDKRYRITERSKVTRKGGSYDDDRDWRNSGRDRDDDDRNVRSSGRSRDDDNDRGQKPSTRRQSNDDDDDRYDDDRRNWQSTGTSKNTTRATLPDGVSIKKPKTESARGSESQNRATVKPNAAVAESSVRQNDKPAARNDMPMGVTLKKPGTSVQQSAKPVAQAKREVKSSIAKPDKNEAKAEAKQDFKIVKRDDAKSKAQPSPSKPSNRETKSGVSAATKQPGNSAKRSKGGK